MSRAQVAAERVSAFPLHPELLHGLLLVPLLPQMAVQPSHGALGDRGGQQGGRVYILAGNSCLRENFDFFLYVCYAFTRQILDFNASYFLFVFVTT